MRRLQVITKLRLPRRRPCRRTSCTLRRSRVRKIPPAARRRYVMRMTLARITIDPAVCTGKPCIRGLRFPVARLLGLLAAGETRESILKAYPYLEPGDIDEALRYAAFLAEDETVTLRPAASVK